MQVPRLQQPPKGIPQQWSRYYRKCFRDPRRSLPAKLKPLRYLPLSRRRSYRMSGQSMLSARSFFRLLLSAGGWSQGSCSSAERSSKGCLSVEAKQKYAEQSSPSADRSSEPATLLHVMSADPASRLCSSRSISEFRRTYLPYRYRPSNTPVRSGCYHICRRGELPTMTGCKTTVVKHGKHTIRLPPDMRSSRRNS